MNQSLLRSLSFLAALVLLVTVCFGRAGSSELLANPGFEGGSQGGAPPPAPWTQGYFPYTAGSVTTATAAHSGAFGLWAYTYSGPDSSFSTTYQTTSASPGSVYQGGAYLRAAPPAYGGTWMGGSVACVSISLRDALRHELASYRSDSLVSQNTTWGYYSVVTAPAPPNAASVWFILYLHKPAGPNGQSEVNADDTTLSQLSSGACCDPAGNCTVTIQADCATPNTWQGANSTCTPNPCPQPTGACCEVDGSCVAVTAALCMGQGLWQGSNTVCNPSPCPQVGTLGACCYLPNNSNIPVCVVTTQTGCNAFANSSWNAHTTCEADHCVTPVKSESWGRIKSYYH